METAGLRLSEHSAQAVRRERPQVRICLSHTDAGRDCYFYQFAAEPQKHIFSCVKQLFGDYALSFSNLLL